MANLSITAADVAIVEVIEQATLPASVAITAGQYVYPTTTGKLVTGSAVAGGGDVGGSPGIAVQSGVANEAVTILKKGIVYLGSALSGLAYDAPVYLSDTEGTLADAAGTVSTVVGHVVPIFGDTTAAKGLRIDL